MSKGNVDLNSAGSTLLGKDTKPRNRFTSSVFSLLLSEHLILYITVLYFLVISPFAPGLGSGQNLLNLLSNMLPLFILATGQTIVLITGGIDLSVTSILALCSVMGSWGMTAGAGWLGQGPGAAAAGVLIMLLVGAAVGAANGLCISRLQMPPFIVTLTSMMFFSGLAIWLTKSQNIYGLPAAFTALGRLIIPSFFLTLIVGMTAHFLLSGTLLGRWLFAVGHNSRTASISGVPVRWVTFSAYIISGISAALASVLYTGRLETGSPVLGQRVLLDVIGATVIGGTSLFGGKGKVLWTASGVLFIALLDNSLNLLGRTGASNFAIMMVKGGVILAAAMADTLRTRFQNRS